MSLKLVSLSRAKEMGTETIEATFMKDGEIKPLKVNANDRPQIFIEINKLLENSAANLAEAATDLFNLMSPEAKVQEQISSSFFLSKSLSIRNGRIYFGEERLEDTLATHMLSLLDEKNAPKDEKMWRSYVKFLDNLHQNVNAEIRSQLFRWMDYENKAGHGFGITDDGCIVGYKGCGGTILEPMSKFEGYAIVDGVEFNGKIPNKVGSVVQMPRAAVTHDPKIGCSQGLHVGTRNYATSWAPILLLVKVNPRDVVSVPFECDSQKMRVCEYTVLKVTDASDEHYMYHGSETKPKERGLLDNLGETVVVNDDGEIYEGTLIDTYPSGDDVVVVIEVDGEEFDFTIDENCTIEVKGPEYELSLEEAYDLQDSGAEVYVEYDDKEFVGVVTSVYNEPGKKPGIIISDDEGEVKHIKLHRITNWDPTEGEKDEDEFVFVDDESEVSEEDFKDLQMTLDEAYELLENEEDIIIQYDGQLFTGYVTSVYDEAYKDPGIIVKNDDLEYKHIKLYRIEDWTYANETASAPECETCEDNGKCAAESAFADLLEIPVGSTLVVVYKDVDGVKVVAGLLKEVNKCELEFKLATPEKELETINFTDIVSIQTVTV